MNWKYLNNEHPPDDDEDVYVVALARHHNGKIVTKVSSAYYSGKDINKGHIGIFPLWIAYAYAEIEPIIPPPFISS